MITYPTRQRWPWWVLTYYPPCLHQVFQRADCCRFLKFSGSTRVTLLQRSGISRRDHVLLSGEFEICAKI